MSIEPQLPLVVPAAILRRIAARLGFEREHMTLIAAFSGAFGMVFLSDSQETVSGYAKRSVDKVEHSTGSPFPYAIAGSGDGTHIDALKFEISGAVAQLTGYSLPEIHETLKHECLDYFQKYIWPRGSDKPALEMLMMTQRKGSHPDLWHIADGTVLWVQNDHRSIGVGSYLADYLAGQLPSFRQDESEMIAGAAFILKEVRDHIDGVGLDRNIRLFRPDGTDEYFDEETLSKFDPVFEQFNALISRMFDSIFCMRYPMDTDELRRCRDELRNDYERVVREIIDHAKRMGYTSAPFRKTSG
jgi:hypothetical protein